MLIKYVQKGHKTGCYLGRRDIFNQLFNQTYLEINSIMKNITKSAALVAAILSLMCAESVNATTITAVMGGSAESGAVYQNFDSLSSGNTGTYNLGNGLSITLTPDAQAYSGSTVNVATAPALSGNNNLYFGSLYTGADNTTYLEAGSTLAAQAGQITFNFSTAQTYLGLLWGSVDADNSLYFYSGANGTGTLLDTITGANIAAVDPNISVNLYTATSTNNTAYVNINTSFTFASVVAEGNPTITFEIDNVAYNLGAQVPDGGMTALMLGLGFIGLVLFGFVKNRLQTTK